MFEQQPTFALLFDQLGLASDDAGMEKFIREHQLPAEVKLHCAEFWNASQRDFLQSHWAKDDEWAIHVDELNQQLHADCNAKG